MASNSPASDDFIDDCKCDICGKTFSTHSNATRHKKNVHTGKEKTKKYECRVCKKRFSASQSCWKHEKDQHNFAPVFKSKMNCSECRDSFCSTKNIMTHYSEAHPDIKIETEEKEFKSVDEFQSWKLQFEKDTASSYVIRSSVETKEAILQKFQCHRSGTYASKSTGKRHAKVGGSNKTGYFCPASISAKTFDKGNVIIKLIPNHIGHQCDVGRLKLSEPEKEDIADMLYAGVPKQLIMRKVAENASPTKQLKLDDLRNIAVSYGIEMDTVQSQNDVLSVDSGVKEMKSKEPFQILLYKSTGKISEKIPDVGAEDIVKTTYIVKKADVDSQHESDDDSEHEFAQDYDSDVDSQHEFAQDHDQLEGDLTIDFRNEVIENEKEAAIKHIKEKHNEDINIENLRKTTISGILQLIPDVENFSSEQCKEMLKCINIAKNKCKSLESINTTDVNLPPINPNLNMNRNIGPQRQFPQKKKKAEKSALSSSTLTSQVRTVNVQFKRSWYVNKKPLKKRLCVQAATVFKT